jgi:hypothetical protein
MSENQEKGRIVVFYTLRALVLLRRGGELCPGREVSDAVRALAYLEQLNQE